MIIVLNVTKLIFIVINVSLDMPQTLNRNVVNVQTKIVVNMKVTEKVAVNVKHVEIQNINQIVKVFVKYIVRKIFIV